ncbi:MAG: hypothetical protein WC880_03090 [Candidatus Paceibacterota bacterium]
MKKQPAKPVRIKPPYAPKLTKSAILVCTCGIRYIKTRVDQVVCIACLVQERDSQK